MAYADFSQPFTLYTDASNLGLGAILAQRQHGEERIIAYASRSLHPAERSDANYSSFKLELHTMKWAVSEKFKNYLCGAKVVVVTDNNPLCHLQTAKLGVVEQRWVAQLANYHLQFRPGKEHTNADVLSRLPEGKPLRSTSPWNVAPEEGLMVGIVEAPGLHREGVPLSWGWDPQRWKDRQAEDPVLAQIGDWLQRGTWPEGGARRGQPRGVKQLLGQQERLSLKEGVVC